MFTLPRDEFGRHRWDRGRCCCRLQFTISRFALGTFYLRQKTNRLSLFGSPPALQGARLKLQNSKYISHLHAGTNITTLCGSSHYGYRQWDRKNPFSCSGEAKWRSCQRNTNPCRFHLLRRQNLDHHLSRRAIITMGTHLCPCNGSCMLIYINPQIEVPLPSTSAISIDTTLAGGAPNTFPLIHLTPSTLLGGGGEQRETMGHLYASQIASTILTKNPEEKRTVLVGFGLEQVETETEDFFDLIELVQRVL